jgi:hypothetical protein
MSNRAVIKNGRRNYVIIHILLILFVWTTVINQRVNEVGNRVVDVLVVSSP